MRQDDPSLIGKTLAEIDAIRAQSSSDDYDPQTDYDPRVQAAKMRQAEFDAWRKANPHVTSYPAADSLAVVIARLEVLIEQGNKH